MTGADSFGSSPGLLTRRTFLRVATLGTVLGSTLACLPGSRPSAAPSRRTGRGAERRVLRILQASHPVAEYDKWFDGEFTQQWATENDVAVMVDHVALNNLLSVAASEVAAQRGHDIVGFLAPPSQFEDQVIDHREILEEAESKLGPMLEVARRSMLNPRTGKCFAFSDNWVPEPVLWRTDLWGRSGVTPGTWDDIRKAALGLKAAGHPLGIGFSQDLDSNMALLSLMASFGSFVQDEQSNAVIDRKETVDAVAFGAELFRAGMTEEVFGWDPMSNNRFLAAGRGSLILNPISALRETLRDRPELVGKIAVAPAPEGPSGRRGMPGAVSHYAIWKFARNPGMAKRLLLHLAVHSRDIALRSGLTNLPSFPSAALDIDQLAGADPILRSAGAPAMLAAAGEWSVNVGYPGYANPAIADVVSQSLIPQMFATVALRRQTPPEAVRAASRRVESIFREWRDRGRI